MSAAPSGKPVLWWVFNKFHLGGAELGLEHLIQSRFFEAFDTHIMCISKGDAAFFNRVQQRMPNTVAMQDTPSFGVGAWLKFMFWLFWRMRSSRPDVMVLSLPQANIAGRVACLMHRVLSRTTKPYVISFEHNTYLSKPLYETLYKRLGVVVDGIFADCNKTAQTVTSRFYENKAALPFWVVPLLSFPDDLKTSDYRPASPLRVITAGRMTATKNHASLIQAINILIDRDIPVSLTIYGDGELRDELETMIQANQLDAHVHLPGFVPDWAERPADVFVLSSHYEGLSIVTLEAMIHGKAVVAPAIGGINDYGLHGHVHIIEQPTPELIADAVSKIATHPEVTAEKVAKQANYVRDLYHADSVRQTLQQVASDLVKAC